MARSAFASQNVQNTPCSEHFGSSDVDKWHTTAARSTFASQNVKNMRGSGHFLTLGCVKLHAAVAPSTFTSQNVKTLAFCTTFGGSDVGTV